MYWLFKKYMQRFTNEFEAEVKKAVSTGEPNANPSWYWVQQLMFKKGKK